MFMKKVLFGPKKEVNSYPTQQDVKNVRGTIFQQESPGGYMLPSS